ncbi:unnamed protein product [Pneumocystis jirovecii]|uniref:Secreted protein n=1 Tax=Pneumocystis jirovecii TaxID=42068 RepID=L0PBH2_PNEJI|nr:unnamed protein product [Pneumocystis jirovecii]
MWSLLSLCFALILSTISFKHLRRKSTETLNPDMPITSGFRQFSSFMSEILICSNTFPFSSTNTHKVSSFVGSPLPLETVNTRGISPLSKDFKM